MARAFSPSLPSIAHSSKVVLWLHSSANLVAIVIHRHLKSSASCKVSGAPLLATLLQTLTRIMDVQERMLILCSAQSINLILLLDVMRPRFNRKFCFVANLLISDWRVAALTVLWQIIKWSLTRSDQSTQSIPALLKELLLLLAATPRTPTKAAIHGILTLWPLLNNFMMLYTHGTSRDTLP